MQLPRVSFSDLNGKTVTLPDDLCGITLLLIAFEREHQDIVDSWVRGLDLRATDEDWLELPVIDDPGFLGRKIVDLGMKAGIRDPEMRGKVVTLYTDRAQFLAELSVGNTETVYVAVVNSAGELLELTWGRYSIEKEEQLRLKWRVDFG